MMTEAPTTLSAAAPAPRLTAWEVPATVALPDPIEAPVLSLTVTAAVSPLHAALTPLSVTEVTMYLEAVAEYDVVYVMFTPSVSHDATTVSFEPTLVEFNPPRPAADAAIAPKAATPRAAMASRLRFVCILQPFSRIKVGV